MIDTPIRIEKGDATDEELAALTVLLLTRASRPDPSTEAPSPETTAWSPVSFAPPHSWQKR